MANVGATETPADRELLNTVLDSDCEDLDFLERSLPSVSARYNYILSELLADKMRKSHALDRAKAKVYKANKDLAPLNKAPTEGYLNACVADNDTVEKALEAWAVAEANFMRVKGLLYALRDQVILVRERAQDRRAQAQNKM